MADSLERRRLVCRCLGVASFRIVDAARAGGLACVADVTKATRAGSGCGTCHEEIEEILADLRGEPVDPGQRLENRLICESETAARVEGSVDGIVRSRLGERGRSLDGLAVDGLVVRVRLDPGASDADYAEVARMLRKYVCADLEVEKLDESL